MRLRAAPESNFKGWRRRSAAPHGWMNGWMTPAKFKFRGKIEMKEHERTFLAGNSKYIKNLKTQLRSVILL